MSRTGLYWYVDLKGPDGNAYVIMGTVGHLVRETLGKDEEDAYIKAATSGDYERLVAVSNDYVELREWDRSAVFGHVDEPDVDAVG